MASYKKIGEDLFIGPQPSEQDLQEAKQQGIRTVLDFRMPSETAASNEDLTRRNGLDYANVPVDKASLSEKKIEELDTAMAQKEGPYLLHCTLGTRAAMLLALSRAKENGWNAERTFEEAKAMGFDLRDRPEYANFVRQSTAQR